MSTLQAVRLQSACAILLMGGQSGRSQQIMINPCQTLFSLLSRPTRSSSRPPRPKRMIQMHITSSYIQSLHRQVPRAHTKLLTIRSIRASLIHYQANEFRQLCLAYQITAQQASLATCTTNWIGAIDWELILHVTRQLPMPHASALSPASVTMDILE